MLEKKLKNWELRKSAVPFSSEHMIGSIPKTKGDNEDFLPDPARKGGFDNMAGMIHVLLQSEDFIRVKVEVVVPSR